MESQIQETHSIPAQKNRRLMIEKIVLENFKSYYGKKEIGPLHKCFSAVVGPNGSGKSNLIESLLFVFGKRAKRMRLNKLSELIHSSAEHQNDVQYAMVEVYFQEIIDDENEPDYFEVIPGTKFRVARTVNRSSTSKYILNGHESTFKEVCELLQGKGIDLEHNRFLILQGEVEQISLMKPIAQNSNETGLLEYLEDIIGSNKYVEKIEQIEKQLEDKNDERIEKTNRFKAAQVELKSLEAEKNVAVQYIRKERDYMLLTNMLYFIELGDGVKYYNESIEQIHNLRDALRKQKELMKQKFQENQELVTEIQQLHLQIETADQKIKELQHEFQLLERSDVMIQNEKKHKMTEIQKLKDTIFQQKKSKEQTIAESTKIEADLPGLEQQQKQLLEQKMAKESEFEKLEMEVRQRTERLRKEKEEINQQKNPLVNQSQQLKSKIENLKQEIEAIEGKTVKVEAEIESNSVRIDQQNKSLEAAQQEYRRHQAAYEEIQKELEDTEKAIVARKNDIYQTEQELRQLKDRKSYMTNSQLETRTKSQVLKELLTAQERGLLSGIHGRLGDLGSIDSKYDTAISTASPQLDYIVTDSVKDGEACINYLRENNIGRGTFIGLDKMMQHQPNRVKQFQAPANSVRLFDLIKSKDDKFLNAFYFAVKDTLVAEDIKIGTNIAFNQGRNYRVVTLNGEMVEITGVMSGGGRPKKGLMSNKIIEEFTDEQIKEVENKIQKAEQKLSQFREDHNKYEQQKTQIQRKIQQQGSFRQKSKVDVDSLTDIINQLNQKAADLDSSLKNAKQEEQVMNNMKKDIQDSSNELSRITPQILSLQDQMKKIESQILDVGGMNYKSMKDDVEKLTQQLSQVERQLTRYRTTLQSSESSVRKFDQEIEKNEQAIEKSEKIIYELQQELDKNDDAGKKILQEIQSCELTKNDCTNKLEERKSVFNQMKKDMQEITDKENEIKNNLDEAGKQKLKYKDHCDKMKQNIKGNREKFKKQEREFEGLIDVTKPQEPEIVALDEDSQVPQSEQAQEKEQQLQEEDMQNEEPEVEAEASVSQAGEGQVISSEQVSQTEQSQKEKSDNQSSKENQRRLELRSQHIKAQGYKYFWRQGDINHTFNDNEIAILARDKQEIRQQAQQIRSELEATNPNIQIIHEFRTKLNDCNSKEKILKDCETFIQTKKEELNSLKKLRHDEFTAGFKFISSKVREMYRLITNGGDAELEIKDSLDPFSEGVLFQVRPFKKSWKHMSKLSGGEKTLSSLALIFALHLYKPSPLYCMDEIDAALDYKNVAIVGKYIREKAKNCQFLIISLRNNMFDLAQKMVGIYKTHDITKTLTINPAQVQEQIEKKRKAQLALIQAQQIEEQPDREMQDAQDDKAAAAPAN